MTCAFARGQGCVFFNRLEAHLYPKLANEAAVPTALRMSLAKVQSIADIIFLVEFFCKVLKLYLFPFTVPT